MKRETTNYEISRTRRQVVLAAGSVKRLSVAVVVDGPYKVTAGKEGQKVRTFTPRSPEQMRQIGDIMRKVNQFVFLTCACGLKLKIPPNFKAPKVKCPRCSTALDIPAKK